MEPHCLKSSVLCLFIFSFSLQPSTPLINVSYFLPVKCFCHRCSPFHEDEVIKKYKFAESNLHKLQKLGACVLHGVDATNMKLHSNLKMSRFDRIIFNFPHAGFHGSEDDLLMIKMHQDLVLGFFKNASCMLRANGEIHVNHKTNPTFSKWNIEELAMQSFLTLLERADFKKEDYPGYNNKRGDSYRCDEPFPLGECSTFKFICNPKAMGRHKRRNHVGSKQRKLPFENTQHVVEQLPTPVHLNYYPPSRLILRLNETYSNNVAVAHTRATTPCVGYSTRGIASPSAGYSTHHGYSTHGIAAPCAGYSTHGYSTHDIASACAGYSTHGISIPCAGYSTHGIAAPCAGYSTHGIATRAPCAGYSTGMSLSCQRLLPPLPPMQSVQPMESLKFLQPWPTSTNVGYSHIDHVRMMDSLPSSVAARNEGHEVFGGNSNYLHEAHDRTMCASYYFDRVRPHFEKHW